MYPTYKSTIEILAVGILYFLLAQFGYLFAMPTSSIGMVWLPSGFAMAAAVVIGYRVAGGIFLGALLAILYPFADAAVPSSLPSVIAVAMGNAGESLLAAALFSRLLSSLYRHPSFHHVLRFLGIAVTSALPSAFLRALQLTGESATQPEYLQDVLHWWAGGSIGIIVGFPLFFAGYKIFVAKSKPNMFVQQMAFLSVCLLLSMATYLYALAAERENLRLRFSEVIGQQFLNIEYTLYGTLRYLSDLPFDFSNELPLSRESFMQHSQAMVSGPYRVPGVFAIAWNAMVMGESRAAFEQSAQQQGYENFSILDLDSRGELQVASDRPFYFPVTHIVPLAYNIGALGYDIYSIPDRRASIDEVMNDNAPILSAPLKLLQSQTPGALLVWPVHTQINPAGAILAGVITAEIRYDELFTYDSTGLLDLTNITVFDVTPRENVTRVFASNYGFGLDQPVEDSSARPFLFIKNLVFAGRSLQVFAEPSPQFLAQNQRFAPLRILLASLLLSVLGTLAFTQRSQNRLVLEGLLERTSKIINQTRDGIIAMSGNGVVTEWNQAAVDLFGYSTKEAVGKHLAQLIIPYRFHHAHEQALLNTPEPGKPSKIFNRTLELIVKDASGIEFPVELVVVSITNNNLIEFIGQIRDLRPRKLFEEKRDEIQKMEILGQLTGGLAHDFNNLMGIVISNLEYLNTHKLLPYLAVHAQNAFDAAWRASQVTRSLMAVARREAMELQPVEINAHLAELMPLMATTVGKIIRLDTSLGTLPLRTCIDQSGFTSAVINLLLNARDALEERNDGRIEIITREVLLPDDEAQLPPGRFACVSVSDNGHGIPEKILKHIMEPFYTTKERGHGTGLGLSMVNAFAQQSNGIFKIESEQTKGTTASIYLPILESHEVETKGHIDSSDLAIAMISARVLVVDDEEFLRRIAAHMIAEMGFVAIQAASADEALQVLRNEQVDILFSDISMPGSLDGIQLAKWVQSELPQVSIILTTGYLDYRRFQDLVPSWQFLEKPYLREDLLRVLRSV
jgi:PAS domain S-box-containing protein